MDPLPSGEKKQIGIYIFPLDGQSNYLGNSPPFSFFIYYWVGKKFEFFCKMLRKTQMNFLTNPKDDPHSIEVWVSEWKLLSRVWLLETPWTIQSMEFSRPEYWSG